MEISIKEIIIPKIPKKVPNLRFLLCNNVWCNENQSKHSFKGWFDEFDTNVISVFDIFACNFGKDWATETCFTSNEQLKPLLFG